MNHVKHSLMAYTVAYARASFSDSFRIDAPGLAGQRGYFTAEVTMPFTLTTQNPVYTNQYLYGDIAVTSIDGQHTEKYQLSAGNQSVFGHDAVLHDGLEVRADTPMILEVPFTYGETMSIEAHLNTSVSGYTNLVPVSFSAAGRPPAGDPSHSAASAILAWV